MTIRSDKVVGDTRLSGIFCVNCINEIDKPIFAYQPVANSACDCCGKQLLQSFADSYSGHDNGCEHAN